MRVGNYMEQSHGYSFLFKIQYEEFWQGIAEERRIRVPFEIKLVKFHDYPEDEKVDSEHNVGK